LVALLSSIFDAFIIILAIENCKLCARTICKVCYHTKHYNPTDQVMNGMQPVRT